MRLGGFGLAALAASGLAAASPAPPRSISFEERLAAQRAIDGVYREHQIGAELLDAATAGALARAEVERTLAQSAALSAYWHVAIDAEALRNETARIAKGTRFPERLTEIYAALGHDGVLVEECLARGTLADRWSRSLFARDPRIHAAARAEAETLRDALLRRAIALDADDPRRRLVDLHLAREAASASDREARFVGERRVELDVDPETFAARRALAPAEIGAVGPVVEEDDAFVVRAVLDEDPEHARLATWTVPKRTWDDWWGETSPVFRARPVATVALPESLPEPGIAAGAAPDTAPPTCSPTDTWDNGALGSTPDGRDGASAVWTGSLMVVWGGGREGRFLRTGGRYDPTTDTWTPTALLGSPTPRFGQTAVWTGSRMIVWGGSDASGLQATGARYDPVADAWTPTSTTGAPSPRENHVAVWTGTRMVVWSGHAHDISGQAIFLDTGGQYDPVGDAWTATATVGAPAGRSSATAVWTGSKMLVWGGRVDDTGILVATGGLYDPAGDAWAPMASAQAPSPRELHTAVWTGNAMVVWGGHEYVGGSPRFLATGGRYDLISDSWSPTSSAGAPQARRRQTAVWDGARMVVWGGDAGNTYFGNGGRYDPGTDTWMPIASAGAPPARTSHVAVWTGERMVVWGGSAPGSMALNSGGRYDPLLDTWAPTFAPNAPEPRESASSVWTGTTWIVWGGMRLEDPKNTGGRYDPMTDSWSPTSLTNATRARVFHTAVWTGSSMIVWGGETCPFLNDAGAKYDPVADSWSPIDFTTEPAPRRHHTAVWTGSKMAVWGGLTCASATSVTSTGALYDPVANTWTGMSPTKAPSAREDHTATWTGSRMIVWGGGDADPSHPAVFDTGAVYDPVANAWTTMSRGGSPNPRRRHTAVWTGDAMIVWGGTGSSDFNTGASYDPAADRWSAIAAAGAPDARFAHTAVWAGDLMVVWGGETSAAGLDAKGTGGRYDPVADAWSPVALASAPSPRRDHVAAWTGSFMLIWGGYGEYTDDSGGRYVASNPDSDLDGVADVCDCAPANPDVYAVPQEVEMLAFDADRTTLRWTSAAASGGTATVHDVVRGSLAALPVGSGAETCVAPATGASSTQDPATPPPGSGTWYLVRGKNACGTGTYGHASGGAERVTAACP